MIFEVDADGNGLIEIAEFLSVIVRKMNNAEKDAEIRDAFSVFDKDSSGKISSEEFRQIIRRSLGEELIPRISHVPTAAVPLATHFAYGMCTHNNRHSPFAQCEATEQWVNYPP